MADFYVEISVPYKTVKGDADHVYRWSKTSGTRRKAMLMNRTQTFTGINHRGEGVHNCQMATIIDIRLALI